MKNKYLYLLFLVVLGCNTLNVSLSGIKEGPSGELRDNISKVPSLVELAVEALHAHMKNKPGDSLNKMLMTINPIKEMSPLIKTLTSVYRGNSDMKELFFRPATKLYFPLIKISEFFIDNFTDKTLMRVNAINQSIEFCNYEFSYYSEAGLGQNTYSLYTIYPLQNVSSQRHGLLLDSIMQDDQTLFHEYNYIELDTFTDEEQSLMGKLFEEDRARSQAGSRRLKKKINNNHIALVNEFVFNRKYSHNKSIRLMDTQTGQCTHYLPYEENNFLRIESFFDADNVFVVIDCTDGTVSTYYVPDHYELSFGAMILHMSLVNRVGFNYFERLSGDKAYEELHEDWFEYYVEILEWLTSFEEVSSASEDRSTAEYDK